MDEFAERQLDVAAKAGEKAAVSQANSQVQLAQGQMPTIDPEVYEPSELVDNGYSLSNPTMEPNRHTREGARVYANRDAFDGAPITPTTQMPDPEVSLPNTNAYSHQADEIYRGLESAATAQDVNSNISKLFGSYIQYTNSLAEAEPGIADEQANRVRWATSDRLELIGFDQIRASERNDEGLDDTGLNGLQMMMSSMILRGAQSFDEVSNLMGDTGANDDQLRETWEMAQSAFGEAGERLIDPIPNSPETAQSDPRYLAASALVFEGIEDGVSAGDMSAEELYDKGMFYIDQIKGNPLVLAAAVMRGKKDPQFAQAVNFLLQADDEMPMTMGDFGRGVLAASYDPLSYVGVGIASKAVSGTIAKTALKRAGLIGAEGAVVGGSYGGLMDYGFQNLSILAGQQESYNPYQTAAMTTVGGGLGFVLGGALGLAPEAISMLARLKKSEFATEPVSAEIIPESEMRLRRDIKKFLEEDNLRKVADGEADQAKVDEFKSQVAELQEAQTPKLVSSNEGITPTDSAGRLELIRNEQLIHDQSQADALIAKIEKHELDTPEGLKKYREEFYTEVQRKMLEKNDIVQEHIDAGDFRFKINDTITSKHSGKEFRIHHLQWKGDEPRYFVEGPEGEKHYMAEWGMVGGNPKLELVQSNLDNDPTLTAKAFETLDELEKNRPSLNRPDAELIEKEFNEFPRAKDRAGHDEEPWIGVITEDGRTEFRNRAEGEAADWHHSMAMTELLDEWDLDSSISFYRPADAKEIVIKGDAAVDPMGKGKKQIKDLAIQLKEAGAPGNYKIRIEQMGLHGDYEGEVIGTIDQWTKRR